MNRMMILAMSLVASSMAFAVSAALQCKETGAGPDDGYSVYVSKNGKRATVEEVTIAGTKQLATLKCTKVRGRTTHPDEISIVLACWEPLIRDGGYSFQVKEGGFAGFTTATLSEVTIAGSNPVAELLCRNAR